MPRQRQGRGRVAMPRRNVPRGGGEAALWEEIDRIHAALARLRVSAGRPRFAAGEFTCPNVDGTDQVVEIPFALSALYAIAAPASATNAIHGSIGFAGVDDLGVISQFAITMRGTTAGPTMARSRSNLACVFFTDGAGLTILRGDLVDVAADSFTLDFPTASNAFDVYWMALG